MNVREDQLGDARQENQRLLEKNSPFVAKLSF